MAEGWKQKRVDIEHWLQAIQPPGPEPSQESYRGLTSNPDISTPDQGPTASISQLSHSESYTQQDLADNTKLLYSSDTVTSSPLTTTSPIPTPVIEPLATISTQSLLESGQTDHQTAFLVDTEPLKQEEDLVPSSKSPVKSPQHTAPKIPGVTVEQASGRRPLTGLKCLRQKSLSPLPQATRNPTLPVFGKFDENDSDSCDVDDAGHDQWILNQIVNKPPVNPMKLFSRASTSPRLGTRAFSPISPTNRKGSSPVTFNTTKIKVDSSLVHHLRVYDKNLSLMSRRKSLSQDDISQLVEKDKTLSLERPSSCSELNEHKSRSNSRSDSQSSTGACGYGSNVSEQGSSNRGLNSDSDTHEDTSVTGVFSFKERGVLSAGSVDALEARLRERQTSLSTSRSQVHDDKESVQQSNSGRSKMNSLYPPLPSPTSPPTHSLKTPLSPPQLSRQPRLSHSPSPTPPTSPYHTPIVPRGVRSETRHPTSSHTVESVRIPRGESERGISMSRLKKFNLSQQFSFDTTNEEMFNRPMNQPKFLRNSNLAGTLRLYSQQSFGSHSHNRSLSDVSSTDSPAGHNTFLPTRAGSSHVMYSQEGTQSLISGRQYKSQLDLFSRTSGGAGVELTSFDLESTSEGRPLKLFEQLQLRKSQTEGKVFDSSVQTASSENDSNKSKVLRQDSGLGTLSTTSQKF